jgi:Flp pilus assembly protein TadB
VIWGPLAAALATATPMFAALALALRRDRVVLRRLALNQIPAGRSGLRPILARVGSWPISRRLARVEQRSFSAPYSSVPGLPSASEIAGSKVALAGVGLALGLISPIPVVSPVLAIAGFKIPEVRISRAISERHRRAARELPLFLDLLAASCVGGLTGQLAVQAAASVTEGPLADEFDRALRAVALGGRWRDELSAVADHLDLPELRRVIVALGRSDALGSSLSDQLSGIAADVREAHRTSITERARTAPVKMLFPLVFLILPSFLLLTVVPVLVTTLRSIR